MPAYAVEVVEGRARSGLYRPDDRVFAPRLRCNGDAAVAIVHTVDADHVEVRRQALDLAKEVVSREPSLPSASGSVFEVAASRTPLREGPSAANSSTPCRRGRPIRTHRCTPVSGPTGPRQFRLKPSAPTRWVYSTNVP